MPFSNVVLDVVPHPRSLWITLLADSEGTGHTINMLKARAVLVLWCQRGLLNTIEPARARKDGFALSAVPFFVRAFLASDLLVKMDNAPFRPIAFQDCQANHEHGSTMSTPGK